MASRIAPLLKKVKIRRRHRINLLAEKLEQARLGPGRFEALGYERFVPVLITAIEFDQLSNIARHQIVHSAVERASKSPPITEDALIRAVRAEEARYRRKKLSSYVVLTQISGRWASRRVARLREATVTLTETLPDRFLRERAGVPEGPRHRPKAPRRSYWARVRVEARSPAEALEFGLWNLDVLRGIWIWALTARRYTISFGEPRPLAPLVVGPLHTVHEPTGKLATSPGWFKLGYVPPSHPLVLDQSGTTRLLKAELAVREELGHLESSYRTMKSRR